MCLTPYTYDRFSIYRYRHTHTYTYHNDGGHPGPVMAETILYVIGFDNNLLTGPMDHLCGLVRRNMEYIIVLLQTLGL